MPCPAVSTDNVAIATAPNMARHVSEPVRSKPIAAASSTDIGHIRSQPLAQTSLARAVKNAEAREVTRNGDGARRAMSAKAPAAVSHEITMSTFMLYEVR